MQCLALALRIYTKWYLISTKFSGVIVRGLNNDLRWDFNLYECYLSPWIKRWKTLFFLKNAYFSTGFIFAPESDFFLNIDTQNCANVYQMLDRPATCLWVFQIKMKWNLIFYRISEILDFHFLFHGRQ